MDDCSPQPYSNVGQQAQECALSMQASQSLLLPTVIYSFYKSGEGGLLQSPKVSLFQTCECHGPSPSYRKQLQLKQNCYTTRVQIKRGTWIIVLLVWVKGHGTQIQTASWHGTDKRAHQKIHPWGRISTRGPWPELPEWGR